MDANIMARSSNALSRDDVDSAMDGRMLYGFRRYAAATSPSRELAETFCRALHIWTKAHAATASNRAQTAPAKTVEVGKSADTARSRGECRKVPPL